MRAIAELTDEEIDALRPCDVLLLIMHTAMRKGDLPLAFRCGGGTGAVSPSSDGGKTMDRLFGWRGHFKRNRNWQSR